MKIVLYRGFVFIFKMNMILTQISVKNRVNSRIDILDGNMSHRRRYQ
jgi:hypothetical protein